MGLVRACSHVGRSMRLASMEAEMERVYLEACCREVLHPVKPRLSKVGQEANEVKESHELEVNLGHMARDSQHIVLRQVPVSQKEGWGRTLTNTSGGE